MGYFKKAVKFTVKILTKIETFALVFLLGLIMFISLSQIILRSGNIDLSGIINSSKASGNAFGYAVFNFFQNVITSVKQKVVWFDPIIQYAVLWIGLIAASLAVNDNKHINIDIAGKLAKGRMKFFVISITNLFAAVFCFIISVSSLSYIINIEIKYGQTPFFNIPRWALLLILPGGFGITGMKFSYAAVKNFYYMITDKKDESAAALPQ